VLAGTPGTKDRTRFESLRQTINWPGEHSIDWERGLLYAYCSPVHLPSGLPGDFAVSLYFGADLTIKDHFRRCHEATWEVLGYVRTGISSLSLFREANRVFARHGLRNTVLSTTDSVPSDLGHTLPKLHATGGDHNAVTCLSDSDQEFIRTSRKFISESSEWQLDNDMQLTIEPQLRSQTNSVLPQVSFHYIVVIGEQRVLAEPDSLLSEFRLTGST
jgi:hypothetical protein